MQQNNLKKRLLAVVESDKYIYLSNILKFNIEVVCLSFSIFVILLQLFTYFLLHYIYLAVETYSD